ncbi:hypothetical protein FA95DRAFT_1457067, partial [Auriscalpium vulgare]
PTPNDEDWVREAYTYLDKIITEPEWEAVLQCWLTLERQLGSIDARSHWLNSDKKVRPLAVASWFKEGRHYDKWPTIKKASAFGRTWRQWWIKMNPAWRVGKQDWPLCRDVVAEETWPELRKGGRNGFVIVLLTLVWWTAAA